MAGTATAGSTNLILHLLAIAREAGIPEAEFDIDLFDEVSRATPVIADLQARRPLHGARHGAAGGTPLLGRRLMEAGLIEDTPTVTGRSLFSYFEGAAETRGPGGDRLRRRARSRRAAASASSTATSPPKAAW